MLQKRLESVSFRVCFHGFLFFSQHIRLDRNPPPISQWKNDTQSINLCRSSSNDQHPALKLAVHISESSFVFVSIFVEHTTEIILWTSRKHVMKSMLIQDEDVVHMLLSNFIDQVLKYSYNQTPNSPRLVLSNNLNKSNIGSLFNFSFLSLAFIVCAYEAPVEVRAPCIKILKDQFACHESREVSKTLMRILGSNMEEQFMRSMNLAFTNLIAEKQSNEMNLDIKAPSPLFSYSISTYGLWKVQLYCPVIAMTIEKSNGPSPKQGLLFTLNHHQLEGVIQFNHKITVHEKWIEVKLNTDNIRCDVVKLVSDTMLKERGVGNSEKHFPSRISLEITPTPSKQSDIISVSVSKSSDNPIVDVGFEKGVEASFESPQALGIHLTASEALSTSLKPWKFEPFVVGNTAKMNWFLYDSSNGREVFSSKPSTFSLLVRPKAWFRNRYSRAYRTFTRQGGVIFAGDEYGESVSWKLDKVCIGSCMEWEIKGWIWVTYWPNVHSTFYTETRRLEFKEAVHLALPSTDH